MITKEPLNPGTNSEKVTLMVLVLLCNLPCRVKAIVCRTCVTHSIDNDHSDSGCMRVFVSVNTLVAWTICQHRFFLGIVLMAEVGP
jgi:hypothetical protein